MNGANEVEPIVETEETMGADAAAPEPHDELGRIERIIESVLFAAATPVSLRRLVDILEGPAAKEVHAAVARLQDQYGSRQRGIQLVEVAGGYQFRTARENAEWVRAIFREKPARLGRAALETLAIVAYKQPVTRAEIEAIRGVDADAVLSTLLARQLIKISGRKEGIGRPLLYTTTPEFLETFGLKDLSELPSLKELGPEPHAQEGATAAAGEPCEGPPTAAPPAALQAGEPSAAATPAENSQPSGDQLAAECGGADPRGARTGERPGGDATGGEGGPAEGPDRD